MQLLVENLLEMFTLNSNIQDTIAVEEEAEELSLDSDFLFNNARINVGHQEHRNAISFCLVDQTKERTVSLTNRTVLMRTTNGVLLTAVFTKDIVQNKFATLLLLYLLLVNATPTQNAYSWKQQLFQPSITGHQQELQLSMPRTTKIKLMQK